MAIDLKTTHHDCCLEVLVSGVFETQDAVDRFPELLSLCRKTGQRRVLIDYREMTGIPTSTEKTLYAFGIQDIYMTHLATGGQPMMVAYVGRPSQVSSFEPGVEVARSNDLPFRLFTSRDDAIAWLGSAAPDQGVERPSASC